MLALNVDIISEIVELRDRCLVLGLKPIGICLGPKEWLALEWQLRDEMQLPGGCTIFSGLAVRLVNRDGITFEFDTKDVGRLM